MHISLFNCIAICNTTVILQTEAEEGVNITI